MILLSLEYNYIIILKLSDWAEDLSCPIDFIDYWYHLCLSEVKKAIEDDPLNKINAFHWTRWREDFENDYQPPCGESFSAPERAWFASYLQYLVYAYQIPSKKLALHYGKALFCRLMEEYYRFHCFGADQFTERFADKYGLPPGTGEIVQLGF